MKKNNNHHHPNNSASSHQQQKQPQPLSFPAHAMRPATHPLRTPPGGGGPSSSCSTRPRRRPDLTLPLPHRDPSLAVPLPLPPPTTSSNAATPALPDLERVRRLGSGAGGMVWLVRHRLTGTLYALKVIYGNHEDAVRLQIRREIEILRTASNPHVVGCHALYEHAGEIQILLEYMDGGSLEGRRISSEPALSGVASQVLQGLAYLHRHRIVHRDIKPSNLLLLDSPSRRVKIADFGVSRILAQTMDPCNSSVGTIAYMSPERINTDLNQGVYDGYAGDIWSFGLSILEFYLGRFPFGEKVVGDWASLMCAICYSDPPEAPPSASREFRSFVSSCLQKDPSKRLTAARLLHHPFITQYSPP